MTVSGSVPGDDSVEPPAESVPSSPDGGRQRIVRVQGARRARLTPAPGTHAEPDARDRESGAVGPSGPNDDRLRRDVPPHY
ncbi:hypothetical protein [Microbacterium resistens]|uniref:hypothetical protein n=1 Tax=Microbacterium resistens TaxID=156977 RepID=UPI0036707942